MSGQDSNRQRRNRVAFRPRLDGPLETRALLSTAADALEIAAWSAPVKRNPPQVQPAQQDRNARDIPYLHIPKVLVADGGKAVRIQDGRGTAFEARITTGKGTIKAAARADGRFDLVVYGTNAASELVIGPVKPARVKGQAHTFNPIYGLGSEVLAVNDIRVKTGKIQSILGYRTVNLSGEITLDNDSPVDRIALNRMLPGATIRTAGTLNTLDIFVDASLAGAGTGLFIGRDLNFMSVPGNLQVTDGAVLHTDRDLGLFAQAAKGTGPAGQGLNVQGNIAIGPTGAIDIGRFIAGPIIVYGDFGGTSRLTAENRATATIIVVGETYP